MRSASLRQLCFGGILVLFALTGCGSSHSPSGGTGYATFSWYLFDIEDTSYSQALTCAGVGAGSVVVTLTDQTTGVVYTQAAVPCADGAMSTADLPVGAYYVSFDLYGDPAIYGNATTRLDGFDVTDDATGNLATLHVLAGANDYTSSYAPFFVQSFTVSWDIYYQSVLTTCAAVGAAYVYLDFMTVDPVAGGSTNWVASPFACATGAGVSYAIPYGPTTVAWSLSLDDATGVDLQVLSGGTVALPTSTNVNLGPQYFTF
jgi:hypothetical protein